MKTRKEGSKARLLGLSCMALVLTAFGVTGVRADAADAKKAPPLVNLAEEKDVKVTVGENMDLKNADLLTDGDKYYLQHDATGNKEGNNWENYQEQGTEVTSTAEGKKGVWVQVDLGASYPLEVINLKRQVYEAQPNIVNGNPGDGKRLNGTKISYQNTAIVIGNKEDLSDGQIVYCEGNPTLPDGVEKPESISSPYQEAMGGQWFYMDYENKNGLGATELGTTKEARYIRVYTENPKGAAVKFMELGIYGYENEQDVQEQNGPRRVIDNENPMMIATAYSNDVYQIGQEKSPELQGYNTVEGRWNAIPDDLKKNNVLLLHTNNLRQFAPDHIGQAYLQAFHEHGLQIAYEQGAPIMLLGLTAAATPEQGGTQYNITADMDYGWLDLMYRMYPNMQGVFNTENFWVGGGIPPTCEGSAKMLEIADRFGGFFVWADQDHGSTVTNIISNENMKKALKEHKDAFYLIYKNTSSSQPDDLKTSSFFQGSWLAGYTGGWGMLSDTWAWDKQFSKLWEGNGGNKYSGWQRLCGEPEALLGMQMMSTYLGGGVIYTFEFPEVVYGTRDTNSPANTHVLTELFRYIVNNPAPSKKEIMEETKAVLYGNVSSSFYSGLSGTPTGFQIYETGRYGIIPVVPAWGSRAEVTEKLIQEADNLGVAPPNVLDVNDKNLSGQTKQKYFKDLYPIEYVGNAFADKWDGTWYLYNNKVNKNEKQHAILPLEGEEESARLKVEMEPHEFMIMNESGDGTAMDITLNNYRVNKDKTVFDNVHNLNWSGTFAPGQGVIPGKVSVYEYMDKYNVVNAPEGKLSPEDNELRTTTFELTKLAKKPEVKVVKGQQPDTDGQPQYTEPKVEFNEETGKAVITIQTNGWVDLSITGLEFVYDEDAQKIEDEPIKSERTNLARGKNVSFSKDASDNSRKSHAVDGNKTNRDNYSDPGGNTGGAHWLQVDLGGVHHVEEVNLYRYWSDSRKYHDTVVLLSPDSSFDPAKTLVLWNGNRDADREWPASLSGTQGETHKLPKGEKEEYIETKDGKTMKVYDEGVCWLDPDTKTPLPKEGEHFDVGYVRVYMNGNIDGTKEGPTNHVVELEVMGETGDVVIKDEEAPTVPGNLRVVSPKASEAEIRFLPSVDNTGVEKYKVSWSKGGEQVGFREVTQTALILDPLEAGSEYTVQVKAVDRYDNESEAAEVSFTAMDIQVSADVASGQYDSAQQVTLTAGEGAEIYYTLDGSQPFEKNKEVSESAKKYEGPITVEKNTILRAAARKDGVEYGTGSWYYLIGAQSQDNWETPKAPSDVRIDSKSSSSVNISWAAEEPGCTYRVYVNGKMVWEGKEMNQTIQELTPLTTYQVYVTAVNERGIESLRSETVELVTMAQ